MPQPSATATPVPLCVDLDGTLIRTDVTWVSLRRLLKLNPLWLLLLPLWLVRGRAFLKARIADRVDIDAPRLPYTPDFLEFLRSEKQTGRSLLLVTAADARLARRVADYLGLFSDVLASDGLRNLRGRTKAAELVRRFGRRGFDYAGNSRVDLPVWHEARLAIVVNAGPRLVRKAAARAQLGPVFNS